MSTLSYHQFWYRSVPTLCNWCKWIEIRLCDWWVDFLHHPVIAQITVSSVQLSMPFTRISYLQCSVELNSPPIIQCTSHLQKGVLLSHKWTFMLFMCFEIILLLMVFQGRDSSVGIVTHYGLDGPQWANPSWGWDFPHPSRPALGLTQLPIQWVPSLSQG